MCDRGRVRVQQCRACRRRSDAVRNAVGLALARGMFLSPAISPKEQTVDQLEEQAVECIVRSDMTHIDPMVLMAQAEE